MYSTNISLNDLIGASMTRQGQSVTASLLSLGLDLLLVLMNVTDRPVNQTILASPIDMTALTMSVGFITNHPTHASVDLGKGDRLVIDMSLALTMIWLGVQDASPHSWQMLSKKVAIITLDISLAPHCVIAVVIVGIFFGLCHILINSSKFHDSRDV